MMWNWLTSALASKATIVLYDGNPVHPGPAALFDLADRYGVTLFGTSAKFLDAGARPACGPIDTPPARLACAPSRSTGSPLRAEGFEYVYAAVKPDVHLASISGGTDLCGCFVAGDPTRPVWAGEIQGPALGMAVDVFDDDGPPLAAGHGRAGVHAAVPVAAARLLGRRRRLAATAPPTTSASPASGPTATSPRGPSTAAW